MKKLFLFGILCLFVVSLVNATNVDCGNGYNPSCHEDDIKNVVNTLDSKDASLQNQINTIKTIPGTKGDKGDTGTKGDKGIQGEQGIQGVAGKNGKDANPLVEIAQNIAIAKNNVWDLVQQSQIDSQKSYISYQESFWSEDKVGGSGISENHVSYLMTGNDQFFQTFKGTFVEYLSQQFASKSDINYVNKRIDLLEARLNIISNKHGIEISDEELYNEYQYVNAKRTNRIVSGDDGYVSYIIVK